MRLNKFIAASGRLSRREADLLIEQDKVSVNGKPAHLGQRVGPEDRVTLNGEALHIMPKTYLLLDKPVGYVCSRKSQSKAKTIYQLLDKKYLSLQSVGRLDKDTSGLILLTNDGDFAHQLTHPSYKKEKEYIVSLDKSLTDEDRQKIEEGVVLEDGVSKLNVFPEASNWRIVMSEGRNRQIRRTFSALGYQIKTLRRIKFGPYHIDELSCERLKEVSKRT